MEEAPNGRARYAVLDDDPTGVQTLGGVRVLLEWTGAAVADALGRARSVHLLTNARAYPPPDVRPLVASAAAAALEACPRPLPILRGDSTLRGHLLEEYLALLDARGDPRSIPLVLAPALPSAGRVTVNGVQYLERDGQRIPVHMTEYANDGPFAYSSSRVLQWAQERTGGLFPAEHGIEVHLRTLRTDGPEAVASAVRTALDADGPTAVALDSETSDDIDLLAAGLDQVIEDGDLAVRCGPALAGALGGVTARSRVPFPAASSVLVVCGSYVPQSVRQLAELESRFPAVVVKVAPSTLAAADTSVVVRIAGRLSELLSHDRLAVLAIDGLPPRGLTDLVTGLKIARGLATIVAAVDPDDQLIVLKGGVTSAVTLETGLRAKEADIIGPVLPGVAQWRILGRKDLTCLVVPGNVGDDRLLVTIVDRARGCEQ